MAIIGGTYWRSRDRYMTPVGSLTGLDVLAHAVATAQSKYPIRSVDWKASLLLDILVSCAIVWTVVRLRLRIVWGIALSFALTTGAALAMCYVLFSYFGYFLGVAASLGGAVLGSAVDLTWRPLSRELGRFLSELREQLAER